MANIELLDEILAYIQEHPEEWNQSNYAVADGTNPVLDENNKIVPGPTCGTAFCIAGHVARKFGLKFQWHRTFWSSGKFYATMISDNVKIMAIERFAAEKLGLAMDDGTILFQGDNSLEDLLRMRDNLAYGRSIDYDPELDGEEY